MAIIRFSTLVNNQSISFNPATDVLLFDDASISAGAISFNYSAINDNIVLAAQGKTILLPSSVLVTSLTSSSLAFADGSEFEIGTAAANTLIGTNGSDYLTGLGGADVMRGGLGARWASKLALKSRAYGRWGALTCAALYR
jgi:Ca2+-binding RTX toxin-like protein